MDPISAVGFAASILTFIDFSYQVVSGTFEVIKSGSTVENAHLNVVINNLEDVTKHLSSRPVGSSKYEDALIALAKKCQEVAEELHKLLDKLGVDTKSFQWKSIKVALNSMWKKGEITNLEKRLEKYRSEILLQLVAILR